MTQVDFYILDNNSRRNIYQMVYRLCEKALSQQLNVYIYTRSDEQANIIDELIWTYKSDSFIPHCVISSEFSPDSEEKTKLFNYPVVIQASASSDQVQIPEQYTCLLINLSLHTPLFHQRFQRIAEMVDKDENEKQLARKRYRFYREQGYSLNKYDL